LIKAVIFDMDGILIDSEPFWKISEIENFKSLGVPLTAEMCETTVGMRIQEVTRLWHSRYPWDISLISFEQLENDVIDGVINLIKKNGTPAKGMYEALEFFREKDLPMAIASSSAVKMINAVIEKFAIQEYFKVTHSAENEEFGKPHPAIYLNTAKMLGIAPEYCLAVEDSFNGLKSAKAAGMKTIAVPEKKFFDDPKFNIADIKLRSLLEIDEECLRKGFH
jgi:sugar-phosphatase